MNEGLEQFLATIIEQCLGEHDMQPPLVIRTVGDNGSVLVAGFKEGAELVVLTKHCETGTSVRPRTDRMPRSGDIEAGPAALVQLETRVPDGFHGNWVSAN